MNYDNEDIELGIDNKINHNIFLYLIFLLAIFFFVFFVLFQFEVFYMYIVILVGFICIAVILLGGNKKNRIISFSTIGLIISILIVVYYYFFSNKIEPMMFLKNKYGIQFNEFEVVSVSLYRSEFLFIKAIDRSAVIIADDVEYYVYYDKDLKRWTDVNVTEENKKHSLETVMLNIEEYLLKQYPDKEFSNIELKEENNIEFCALELDGSCFYYKDKENAYSKIYSVYSKTDNKNFNVIYTYDNDLITIDDDL